MRQHTVIAVAFVALMAGILVGVLIAAQDPLVPITSADVIARANGDIIHLNCQEDEVIWWIDPDIRGCVHLDDLFVSEVK